MLSKKTKYAFQALIYLGCKDLGETTVIQEISDRKNIPKKFLENILLELRKQGVLGSKKGKGGGYYLQKKPYQINIAFLVRHLDGPIAMVPCASKNYYAPCNDCEDEETCAIKKIMIQVRNQTLEVLETKTLQDFIDEEKKVI